MEPTETLTFLGTIAELKAVLKASEIKHSIKDEDDAYLKVDLRGALMTSVNVDFYGSRYEVDSRSRSNRYAYAVRRDSNALAKGIIKGTANGSTVDLEVDLETDETMSMYKEVHERWQQFYAYLVSRGRLGQEPEAAAQTEIDGGRENLPDDENQLRQAIYSIEHDPSTKEWWRSVALLFWGCKRKNIKMTYEKLAAILGLTDPKYVGERMREYKPPKTT